MRQPEIPQLSQTSTQLSAAEVAARQKLRNALIRRGFLQEFGSDPALEGDLEIWRREEKIFAVIQEGTMHVPTFQFDDDGRPLPAIAALIQMFRSIESSDWGLALWFIAGSGWLGGRRPVDVLKDDPEAVVEAARRELFESIF